jgi:hypothetical protein
MSDRTFTIPALYIGQPDATLLVHSADGETAVMRLSVDGREIARGWDFRRPEIGPYTWWDAPEHDVVGTFAVFFQHAIETGEHDGWEFPFADEIGDWDSALAIYAAELEDLQDQTY